MKRFLPFFFISLLFLLGCQGSEEEKINHVLMQREEALQKRDPVPYLSCISKDYHDKDEGFEQLTQRIEGYFKTFDRIEYTSWDRSIHIDGKNASVTQQFHLEVERGGKRNRYAGKEFLLLRKEGGTWRIIRGL
jgi:hypothetical protein